MHVAGQDIPDMPQHTLWTWGACERGTFCGMAKDACAWQHHTVAARGASFEEQLMKCAWGSNRMGIQLDAWMPCLRGAGACA